MAKIRQTSRTVSIAGGGKPKPPKGGNMNQGPPARVVAHQEGTTQNWSGFSTSRPRTSRSPLPTPAALGKALAHNLRKGWA